MPSLWHLTKAIDRLIQLTLCNLLWILETHLPWGSLEGRHCWRQADAWASYGQKQWWGQFWWYGDELTKQIFSKNQHQGTACSLTLLVRLCSKQQSRWDVFWYGRATCNPQCYDFRVQEQVIRYHFLWEHQTHLRWPDANEHVALLSLQWMVQGSRVGGIWRYWVLPWAWRCFFRSEWAWDECGGGVGLLQLC